MVSIPAGRSGGRKGGRGRELHWPSDVTAVNNCHYMYMLARGLLLPCSLSETDHFPLLTCLRLIYENVVIALCIYVCVCVCIVWYELHTQWYLAIVIAPPFSVSRCVYLRRWMRLWESVSLSVCVQATWVCVEEDNSWKSCGRISM